MHDLDYLAFRSYVLKAKELHSLVFRFDPGEPKGLLDGCRTPHPQPHLLFAASTFLLALIMLHRELGKHFSFKERVKKCLTPIPLDFNTLHIEWWLMK